MPLLVVAMLVLVTIAVAALLPARLVASKDVTEADGTTHEEATPYALVPAAAQPVAGRVSYDDVASSALADVDIDTHPDGRVYFVTVSEPAQSLLGRFVGLARARGRLAHLRGQVRLEHPVAATHASTSS